MRRRAPGEALERLRRAHLASGLEPLRRRAARWGVDHEAALRGADPAVPPELHDRQADNWRPLLAIADRAGGAWPELARRAAACRLSGAGAEPEQGAAVPLLADLRALFARTGAAPLATTAILRHLVALEERPWAAYTGGQPLTPRPLATWLAGFQIRPKQIRQGAVTRKG